MRLPLVVWGNFVYRLHSFRDITARLELYDTWQPVIFDSPFCYDI